MSIAEHIKSTLILPVNVTKGYISDLSDDQLLIRPHEKANHIAWQLGHLISSEHMLINMAGADSMPPLPDDFADRHSKETAASNDPANFCSKDEYLTQMDAQRAGTLKVLESLSDEELLKPAPENIQRFAPTIGALFSGQASHWLMHAGQWVVVRRMLGKEPLF